MNKNRINVYASIKCEKIEGEEGREERRVFRGEESYWSNVVEFERETASANL